MAPHFIPGWMPDPTNGDPFFIGMAVFIVLLCVGLGTLYLRLHALPEQMAHGVGAAQMQIVSVLALLALFTHNNVFWILALLLAGINLPDLLEPLRRMATALERIGATQAAVAGPVAAPNAGPVSGPDATPVDPTSPLSSDAPSDATAPTDTKEG